MAGPPWARKEPTLVAVLLNLDLNSMYFFDSLGTVAIGRSEATLAFSDFLSLGLVSGATGFSSNMLSLGLVSGTTVLALVQPPPVRTFSRPRSSVGSRRGRGVRAEEQRVT